MKRVLQRLPYVRYCTTRDDECVLDEVALGLDELDLSKPTRTVEHRLSTKSRHAPRRWPGFMTAAVDTEAPLIPRHINSYSTIPSTWVEFQDQSDEVAKTLSGVPEADPGWKEEARKRFALIKSERSPSVLDAVNYITPETAFKIARRVSRRVCYHAGSVHSSRGWGALTRLKRSKSGVYVSDSWVQAVQVYCMLLEAGVPCNLSTKQICRRQLHARHTVSTLDEVDYQTKVDVGVLDNGDRAADIVDGHLYTAALMGLPAREFHVLGCREGMPMIRQLSEACGDRFLTRGYEDPVQDVGVVQSTSDVIDLGDVVVVDSASTAQLLRTLKHSCGVIHAAMSRDLLVSQVQAFHDKKVDVLLADVDILSSSALFLRASRMVVPDEMHGHSKLHMVVGRCEHVVITDAVARELSDRNSILLFRAGILPTPSHLVALYEGLQQGELPDVDVIPAGNPVSQILSLFSRLVLLDTSRFFICDTLKQEKVGELIGPLRGLSWIDAWVFCNLPVSSQMLSSSGIVDMLSTCITRHAAGVACLPPPSDPLTVYGASSFSEACESLMQQHILYYHLSQRFPDSFPHIKEVFRTVDYLTKLLMRELSKLNRLK